MTAVAERAQLLESVISALFEVLDRPVEAVTEQTSLFNEIGLDSTGVLDLLMSLEESLGLEFDMESLEMKDFASVGSLADFLAREQAA